MINAGKHYTTSASLLLVGTNQNQEFMNLVCDSQTNVSD